jgi:large subunit ribosomal protein L37Ae
MGKSTKRLGPRYGRTIRTKLEKIETKQKSLCTCPDCHKKAVKRLAVGIWQCRKCDSKFAGKAYEL